MTYRLSNYNFEADIYLPITNLLKKLSLDHLSEVVLNERKMGQILGGEGGYICQCGCHYEGMGGSSTATTTVPMMPAIIILTTALNLETHHISIVKVGVPKIVLHKMLFA